MDIQKVCKDFRGNEKSIKDCKRDLQGVRDIRASLLCNPFNIFNRILYKNYGE